MFGGATISSYLFLGFLLVLCKAQQYQHLKYGNSNDQEEEKKVEPLFQCYDCNSEYDPRCGDPFDPYTIGKVNCSQKKVPEHLRDQFLDAVLCRKMVQKVEGKVRVIRGCGYIRDVHDDKKCFRRTGTSAVEVIHCACTQRLCNTGQSLQRPTFIVILLAVVYKLAITSLLNGLL